MNLHSNASRALALHLGRTLRILAIVLLASAFFPWSTASAEPGITSVHGSNYDAYWSCKGWEAQQGWQYPLGGPYPTCTYRAPMPNGDSGSSYPGGWRFTRCWHENPNCIDSSAYHYQFAFYESGCPEGQVPERGDLPRASRGAGLEGRPGR